MNVYVSHNGMQTEIEVPARCDLGHIRSLRNELEDLGIPSSYTLAVNGVGCEDTRTLEEGDIVTFRPKEGNKGRAKHRAKRLRYTRKG